MERVVGNYHVCAYKDKMARQALMNQKGEGEEGGVIGGGSGSAARQGSGGSNGGGGSCSPIRESGNSPGATLSTHRRTWSFPGNGSGSGSEASGAYSNPYETTEHFTHGVLPILGMRVSVSRDDLQQLRKEASYGSAGGDGGGGGGGRGRMADAYPTSERKEQ